VMGFAKLSVNLGRRHFFMVGTFVENFFFEGRAFLKKLTNLEIG